MTPPHFSAAVYKRLAEVGQWLKINGAAIYGTGPTPFGAEAGKFSDTEKDKNGKPKFVPAWDWRCTSKPGKLFLVIFNWPADGKFQLPALHSKVRQAYLLAGYKKVKFSPTADGVTLKLPATAPDNIASVVCVEIAEEKSK